MKVYTFSEIQVYLVHKPLATFFGGYNDDWLIPVVKQSDHQLEVEKLKTEIEILRKYTTKYQGMFSYIPRGTQEFCEMTKEITEAISKLGKG